MADKQIRVKIGTVLDKTGLDATTQAVQKLNGDIKQASGDGAAAFNVLGGATAAMNGNINGVIGSVTHLIAKFKILSMMKLSLIGAAITGVIAAVKAFTDWVHKCKVAQEEAFNASMRKEVERLAGAYDKLSKSMADYHKATGQKRTRTDKLQGQQNDADLLENEQSRQTELRAAKTEEERKAINEIRDARKEAIEQGHQLYKIQVDLARAETDARKNKEEYIARGIEAIDIEQKLKEKKKASAAADAKLAATSDDHAKELAKMRADELKEEVKILEQKLKTISADRDALRDKQIALNTEILVGKEQEKNLKTKMDLAQQAREEAEWAEFTRQNEEKRKQLLEDIKSAEEAVAAAEKRLEQTRNNENIKQQTEEMREQAQLLQDQVKEAQKLVDVANKGGNKGRLRNIEEKNKADREAKKLEERQNKRDKRREDGLLERSKGEWKFDFDKKTFYLGDKKGNDISGKLSKKDKQLLDNIIALKNAEALLANAKGKANAFQNNINALNNQGNPVAQAEQALKDANANLTAAKIALGDFTTNLPKMEKDLQDRLAGIAAQTTDVISQVTANSEAAVKNLDRNFQTMSTKLEKLLAAQ